MAGRNRILVIEDEARWREDILREALEDKGYEVQTSESYRKAMAALKRNTFDLIVVDVNLTGVSGNQDGIRIVERLASTGNQTPVIVVSGSKTRDIAQESLQKYCPVAFIDKTTFDISKFVKTVVEALSEQGEGLV